MDAILGLRPFVPARDFGLSKRFYQALGFSLAHDGERVALLRTEGFSFLLQDFYVKELAENCMVQLLVRDVEAWWARVLPQDLVARFSVQPPRPPAMQGWGMRVGFVFDPSGVLWHVTEAPRTA